MLEKLHATQVLPIGILHPSSDNLLITEVAGVFEVVQGNHQTRTYCWSTIIRAVGPAKDLFESLPFYDLR